MTSTPFESDASVKTPIYKRKWVQITGAALVAFTFGVASSGSTETRTVEVAGPETVKEVEVEVIKEVPGPVKEIVTVPESCLTALSAGERGFDIASEGFGIVGDIMGSVAEFDVDGIVSGNEKLVASNGKLTPVSAEWNASKEACRSAAQ